MMIGTEFYAVLATSLSISLACFICLWLLSLKIKDASIVDILWGPACALPAWVAFVMSDGVESRKLLLTLLVTIWALRLAWHIGIRNIGGGEDPRYTRMRKRVKDGRSFAWYSLTRIFVLQSFLSWLISWPVQIGQIYKTPETLGFLAWLGVGVWSVGVFFEAVGDYQLRQFKKNTANRGKLMDRGLWSWTRHPNYFGDSLVWFGLTLIALENPIGLVAVFSPFIMLYFLVYLSGKALLERDMSRRYPDYEDYKARVSGFFPKPPKKPSD